MQRLLYFVFFLMFFILTYFHSFQSRKLGLHIFWCEPKLLQIKNFHLLAHFTLFPPPIPCFLHFCPFSCIHEISYSLPKGGGMGGGSIIIYTTAQKFYKFCLQLFSELLFLGGQRCKVYNKKIYNNSHIN